jgi:hypothetical protein
MGDERYVQLPLRFYRLMCCSVDCCEHPVDRRRWEANAVTIFNARSAGAASCPWSRRENAWQLRNMRGQNNKSSKNEAKLEHMPTAATNRTSAHWNALRHSLSDLWSSTLLFKYITSTVHSPVVTIRTTMFKIHKSYILPTQCIYAFCVDLRTNSDYFPIQH